LVLDLSLSNPKTYGQLVGV